LRLHYSATSPYVRKVRVLLAEAGRTDDVALVQAAGTPLDSGGMPLAQNPLGKIPTLERDDGPALFDSRVICRFLDAEFGTNLYPPAPALWSVLTIEALADGITDAAIAMVYETRLRSEAQVNAQLLEGYWEKITRALGALETRWMADLARTKPDMAQIAVGTALGYLDFRHQDRPWRSNAPNLGAWYAVFSARPSMLATVPPDR
jgi:glutathione S-transferase